MAMDGQRYDVAGCYQMVGLEDPRTPAVIPAAAGSVAVTAIPRSAWHGRIIGIPV